MTTKNITLKIDQNLLRQAKHIAIEADKSLSQWAADLISQEVSKRMSLASSKKRALEILEKGFNLGGKPLSRDDIYRERT